jgi:hypothetical protein
MSDFKELVKGYINTINEGAYSNGRYEHPEGKIVNKYNPGHANPIFTHDTLLNGKKHILKRYANVPYTKDENPMNPHQEYSEYKYKKGEVPNGYIAWTADKEIKLQEAYEKLMTTMMNTGKSIGDDYLRDHPSSFIVHLANGYTLKKIDGTTKVQQLIIDKEFKEYSKLKKERDIAMKNNEKYDNSRSDRQIKKDINLYKKQEEMLQDQNNPQTQSRAWRKSMNGSLKRYNFGIQKSQEKDEERKNRMEYIKQKDEENKKNQWTKEAHDKRIERQKIKDSLMNK